MQTENQAIPIVYGSAQVAMTVETTNHDAVVEQWFQDTFHNLPIDPELYSRFHAAKERLKEQLRGALKP